VVLTKAVDGGGGTLATVAKNDGEEG